MSDGAKEYWSPEDLFPSLVCLRVGVGMEVCFRSDLDNDRNVSLWMYMLFPQSCPQWSGYANFRSEME